MSHRKRILSTAVISALVCGVWAANFPVCQSAMAAEAETKAPDNNAEADYEAALALIREQKYAEAIPRLAPYARKPAEYPVQTSDYLAALTLAGKSGEAIRLYESLPGSFPKRNYLLQHMATAYQASNKPELATPLFRELVHRGALDNNTVQALSRQPAAEQDALLNQARKDTVNGVEGAGEQLVVLTRLFRGDAEAVQAIRKYRLDPASFPLDKTLQLAWICVSQKDGDTAYKFYNSALRREAGNFEALNGRVYALALRGKYEQVHRENRALERVYPRNLKVLYARAYTFEKERRFIDAIKVYEHMLTIIPGNETVDRLRIRAYSDMGASLHALDDAHRHYPQDKKLEAGILGDYALDTIAWEKPKEAVSLYNTLNSSPETVDNRFLYDELYALGEAREHQRAVERYEELMKAQPEARLPAWILSSVAGSYLYIEKPDEALEIYDKALQLEPTYNIATQGKLDTLVELREWSDARDLRDKYDERTADYIKRGKIKTYNNEQWALDISRGWALMYENRYRDAEKYWQELYEKAPASLEVRNARAHLHSWRGWPRQAAEDFAILASMDPNHKASKPGRIAVMNELKEKEKAREEADALYKAKPDDKRTQMLIRELEIEEMNHNQLAGHYVAEDDGSRDWWIKDEISTPLSLYTRLHASYLHRRTWNKDIDDEPVYLRRAGLGLSHTFNEDWSAKQMFSVSTDDGDDFGSATELSWTPDDHWRVEGFYDTFYTDIAHQARRRGVTAKKAELSTGYRESEWRDYHGSISRQVFSDDNDRDEATLGYEQDLFTRNDWRMRIYADLYGARNSEWDNPAIDYFNPKYIWSATLTHMTEQTLVDVYNDYFAHRLYLTIGVQKQYAYAERMIRAIKYEHEYTLSHQNHLVWNVEYRETYYDDDRTGSIGVNLIWNLRF